MFSSLDGVRNLLRTDSLVLFLSAWIILSIWAGYTIGISLMVPFAAMGLLFFHKKWDEKSSIGFYEKILVSLIGLGAAFVFFIIQGGYDLSADSAVPFASSVITESIPLTYAPFFDVPFLYPAGVPALVSQLTAWGGSFHFWSWVLGWIGLLFFFTAIIKIAKKLFSFPEVGVWAAILLLGVRVPFHSLLTGEYSLLVSLGIGLYACYFSLTNRKEVSWICWGASFLCHPYGFAIAFLTGIILSPTVRKTIEGALFTVAVGIPVLVHQIIPFVTMGGGTVVLVPVSLGISLISFFFLSGPVLVLMFLSAILLSLLKKIPPIPVSLILLFFIGLFGYVFGSFLPQLIIIGKMTYVSTIAAILGGSYCLSSLGKRTHLAVKAGIVLLCLLLIFTSSSLIGQAYGTKATLSESEATARFSDAFPNASSVLFVSRGQGKMSQFAGTKPIDPLSTHFFTSFLRENTSLEEMILIRDDVRQYKEAFSQKCVSCMYLFDWDYLVINTSEFPSTPEETPVWSWKEFVAYRRSP